MSKKHTQSHHSIQQTLFWVFFTCIMVLLSLHIYFIYRSAHFSFALEHDIVALHDMEREYQQQEEEYFSLLKQINTVEEKIAYDLVQVSSPRFVSRQISVALLTE